MNMMRITVTCVWLDFSVNLRVHKVLATSLSKARHSDRCKYWRRAVVNGLECRFHCALTTKHTLRIINFQLSAKNLYCPLHHQHLT